MKISARNVFPGTVAQVKAGAVNSEVYLTTKSGITIVGVITNESVAALGLRAGAVASALVKASSVLVMTQGEGVRLSARNCLAGKVSGVMEGPVSADVAIGLPGGETVHATITRAAALELGLKPGIAATAVFKAPSVIFAVAT